MESGIEIGFRLIDLVESCPSEATRLVADAKDVCLDVLARVKCLDPAEGESFEPLVAELRRAIDRAIRGRER